MINKHPVYVIHKLSQWYLDALYYGKKIKNNKHEEF